VRRVAGVYALLQRAARSRAHCGDREKGAERDGEHPRSHGGEMDATRGEARARTGKDFSGEKK
jgi:hypothetical protein